MSSPFKGAKEWVVNQIAQSGLPRPYFYAQPQHQYKDEKVFLHVKVPVPWQSKPGNPDTSPILLDVEKEKIAVKEGLCSYCGIKIAFDEVSIRWAIEKQDVFANTHRDWVPSDFHPLHIECMRQARVFCPFMRTLKDSDFVVKKHQENLDEAKKNYFKFFVVPWDTLERPL